MSIESKLAELSNQSADLVQKSTAITSFIRTYDRSIENRLSVAIQTLENLFTQDLARRVVDASRRRIYVSDDGSDGNHGESYNKAVRTSGRVAELSRQAEYEELEIFLLKPRSSQRFIFKLNETIRARSSIHLMAYSADASERVVVEQGRAAGVQLLAKEIKLTHVDVWSYNGGGTRITDSLSSGRAFFGNARKITAEFSKMQTSDNPFLHFENSGSGDTYHALSLSLFQTAFSRASTNTPGGYWGFCSHKGGKVEMPIRLTGKFVSFALGTDSSRAVTPSKFFDFHEGSLTTNLNLKAT